MAGECNGGAFTPESAIRDTIRAGDEMAFGVSQPVPRLLWPAGPLPGAIGGGEAHVWVWSFAELEEPREADLEILDEQERHRTARFYFAPDRVRYAACHAKMRRILGSYLGRPPDSLVYREGGGGKPGLALAPNDASIRFNLSHSKTIGVLAVTVGMEVGVDVEDVRPIEREVAKRYFSAAEFASMEGLDEQEWLDAFYRCWTRKEAILKAEGLGLRIPLDSFDVSVRAEEPAKLLAARPEAKLSAKWQLHPFEAATGTMGALAIGDASARIRMSALPTDAE